MDRAHQCANVLHDLWVHSMHGGCVERVCASATSATYLDILRSWRVSAHEAPDGWMDDGRKKDSTFVPC